MHYASTTLKKYLFLVAPLSILLLSACGGGGSDDDDEPDQFYFDDVTDAGLGEYVESDYITVEGINTEAKIWIEGGEYAIDGGEYTDEEGEVVEDQIVFVRVLTSEELSTETEATLYIGESEDIYDTFTVRTVDISLSARNGMKSIVFSWPPVSGAVDYKVLEKDGPNQDFKQLGRLLNSEAVGLTVPLSIHKHDWINSEYKLEACTNETCSTTDEISVHAYMERAIGYFKANNSEENDGFSHLALSADGETIAVGAPGEDSGLPGMNRDSGDNSTSGSGAVYVYVKDDSSWRLQSYIKAPAPGDGDNFGTSVSLSSDGNTLAVGVPWEDGADFQIDGDHLDNNAQDSGAVFVYQRFGDTWVLQNYIKASNGAGGDAFGSLVELSDFGSHLAVSAPLGGTGDRGAVYLYTLANDAWSEADILEASTQQFANSISLSANGSRLAVGARQFDYSTDQSLRAGKVYLYDKAGSVWNLTQELSASNPQDNMEFGFDVSLSMDGANLIVGAPGESSDAFQINGNQQSTALQASGAAYVFIHNGTSWVQQAYLKAENSDAADRFGAAVAINSDGSNVVVGAPGEASSATGVQGSIYDNSMPGSGAAYVFLRENNEWTAGNYVKAPNTNESDQFGRYLELDASGDALVLAAPFEDSDAIGINGSRSNNTAREAGAIYLY